MMSAFAIRCPYCGAQYTVGNVNGWIFPPHLCPKAKAKP